MMVICISFIFSFLSYAQIEIIQLNSRFGVIKVPSKYVEVGFESADDDLLLCWLHVATPEMNFDFIYRRAVEKDECVFMVQTVKKILKRSKNVEIFGNGPGFDKAPYPRGYYSMFEMIQGDSGCMSYFGGDECNNKESIYDEMLFLKYREIDPELLFNSISVGNLPYSVFH